MESMPSIVSICFTHPAKAFDWKTATVCRALRLAVAWSPRSLFRALDDDIGTQTLKGQADCLLIRGRHRIDRDKEGNADAYPKNIDQGPVSVMAKLIYHVAIIHERSLFTR